MRCPNCGSTGLERYRSPVTRQDVVLRRHRCKTCGRVSLSAQVVVSGALSERLLPLLEDER